MSCQTEVIEDKMKISSMLSSWKLVLSEVTQDINWDHFLFPIH